MDKKTFEQLIKDGKVTVTGFLNAAGEFIGDEEKLNQYAAAYVTETGVIEIDNGEVVLTPEYKENHGGGGSYKMNWSLEGETLTMNGTGRAFIMFSVYTESYDPIDDFEVSFSADFPADSMNVFSANNTPIESGVWYNSAIFDDAGPKAIKFQSLVNENSSTPFTLYTRKDGQVMSKSCTVEVEEVLPYYWSGDLLHNLHDGVEIATNPESAIRGSLGINVTESDEPVSRPQKQEVMFEFPENLVVKQVNDGVTLESGVWYDCTEYGSYYCALHCTDADQTGTLTINGRVRDENNEIICTLLTKSYSYSSVFIPIDPNISMWTNDDYLYLGHKGTMDVNGGSVGSYGPNQCSLYFKVENDANFKFYKDDVEIVPVDQKYVFFEGTVQEWVDAAGNNEAPALTFELMSRRENINDEEGDILYTFSSNIDIAASETVEALNIQIGNYRWADNHILDDVQQSTIVVTPNTLSLSQNENLEFTIKSLISYADYSESSRIFTISVTQTDGESKPTDIIIQRQLNDGEWLNLGELPSNPAEEIRLRIVGGASPAISATLHFNLRGLNSQPVTDVPVTISAAPEYQGKLYYNFRWGEYFDELVFTNGIATINKHSWEFADNQVTFKLYTTQSDSIQFSGDNRLITTPTFGEPIAMSAVNNLALQEITITGPSDAQAGDQYYFELSSTNLGTLRVNIDIIEEDYSGGGEDGV